MPLATEELQALRKRCDVVLPGFRDPDLATGLRRLADWCDANGAGHDTYGEGALIEDFETKVAMLLGKPVATFVPSGTMAQLAAMRVWTERAKVDRIGLHPTSHLLLHERQAYAALMHLHGVPIGDRLRPMTAADLEAVHDPLASVVVELPIREAGGQLPTWDELEALKAKARERGIALHMDGARLWESAAWYGRSYAEIAEGFDSVYVSLYKGIGAPSGAMLIGDAGFIAQARLWRGRMGGTLHRAGATVAAAAMRFDERIALMPVLFRRTVALAAALSSVAGLRVNPAMPQANMLHLHFDADAEAVMAARDALAEEDRCWIVNRVRATEVPGWSVTEFYVGDLLLDVDDATVTALFAKLIGRVPRS